MESPLNIIEHIDPAISPKDGISGRIYTKRRLRLLARKLDYRLFLGSLELILWGVLLGIDITAAIIGSKRLVSYSLPITQIFIGVGAVLLIVRAFLALYQMGKLKFRVLHLLKTTTLSQKSILGKRLPQASS